MDDTDRVDSDLSDKPSNSSNHSRPCDERELIPPPKKPTGPHPSIAAIAANINLIKKVLEVHSSLLTELPSINDKLEAYNHDIS